jgi:hypothetical protein
MRRNGEFYETRMTRIRMQDGQDRGLPFGEQFRPNRPTAASKKLQVVDNEVNTSALMVVIRPRRVNTSPQRGMKTGVYAGVAARRDARKEPLRAGLSRCRSGAWSPSVNLAGRY